jgi:radical SAM-linked protein
MGYSKVRMRFQKTGNLRLISHHDLMRCFERLLRRAALPIRWTQGFNPHPRLVFAAPLPLGIVGSHEIVDLELEGDIAPSEVQERTRAQAPPGLLILETHAIDPKSTAHVCRAGYRVPMPPDKRQDLSAKIAALLAVESHWVERTRPKARRFDLKLYLQSLQFDDAILDMILRVTPNGGARPDEVLHALGLGDLMTDGVIIERFLLELEDETAPSNGVAGQVPEPSLSSLEN